MARATVAIVGSLASEEGFCASKLAMELDGSRIGECLVIDGVASPLTLVDRAGSSELVMLAPLPGEGDPVVRVVGPPRVDSEQDLVRSLWPAMTGTVDPGEIALSASILAGRRVIVVLVPSGRNCRERLLSFLENFCGEAREGLVYPSNDAGLDGVGPSASPPG